jgi:ABC-type transporter Mla subunit MlaD
MSDSSSDPLADLFALVGLPNPLAGVTRSVDQFRRGVDELLTTMERFNDTLEQLNGVARRLNGFLDEIEEPVKAAMPQVTRTVKAADAITQQMTRLPGDLTTVVDSLGDVARRLQPLTQLADSATSMLGLRSLANLVGRATVEPSPEPAAPTVKKASAAKKAPAVKKAPAANKAPAAKKPTAQKPTGTQR